MDRRQFLVGGLAALALPGCGYSLSGRGSFLPASIKTIGVPLFTNATNLYEIERRITDRVRGGADRPRTLDRDADGRGRRCRAHRPDYGRGDLTPAAFNAQQQATRLVLTLVASVELRDVKANKVDLERTRACSSAEQYDVTTASSALDASAFLGRNDMNALDRLASEFARAVVSAMLEAF